MTKSQKYTYHHIPFPFSVTFVLYKFAVGFRERVDIFVHEQFQLDLGRFLRLSYRFGLYRSGTQPGWHAAISPRHDTPTQLSHLAMVPQYGNQPWLTNTLICCHFFPSENPTTQTRGTFRCPKASRAGITVVVAATDKGLSVRKTQRWLDGWNPAKSRLMVQKFPANQLRWS